MSASSVNVRGIGDFPFATKLVGTNHYQKISLDLGDENTAQLLTSGQKTMALSVPVVLASDQSAIPVTVSGTGAINIAQYGGVATSLGQKAESASIPVTLATTQDTADTDATWGNFTRIGVPWYDTGGPSFGWKAWPITGDGQFASTPIIAIWGQDPTSSNPVALNARSSTPGASDSGLVTRSIGAGIDGVTARHIAVDASGFQKVTASSLPLPTGAATSALQTTVIQNDGVSGLDCLRVMGWDLDSSAFTPIPIGGFGTYIPVSIATGLYGTGIANTGTFTGAAQTVILNTLDGFSEGIITVTGTYSQTFAFEALKNATWYALPVWRAEGGVAAESSSGALVNTSRAWRFNCAGFDTIRIRCSTYVSGTANVEIKMCSYGTHTSNTLLPTGQTTMASSQSVSIASDQTTLPAGGNVAHDAADSGNPLKVGGRARTSNITAVANNDRVDMIADRLGRQVVQPYTLDENTWVALNASDITNTTSTSIKAAIASTRFCITAITVSNMHATVSTRVDILDGTTRIWTGPAAALGGGYSITFPAPIPLTTNTAINAQCGTTGAAVRVAIAGFSIT